MASKKEETKQEVREQKGNRKYSWQDDGQYDDQAGKILKEYLQECSSIIAFLTQVQFVLCPIDSVLPMTDKDNMWKTESSE